MNSIPNWLICSRNLTRWQWQGNRNGIESWDGPNWVLIPTCPVSSHYVRSGDSLTKRKFPFFFAWIM